MKWKLTLATLATLAVAALWTQKLTGQDSPMAAPYTAAICDMAKVTQNYAGYQALLEGTKKARSDINAQIGEKEQAIQKLADEMRALNEDSDAFGQRRAQLDELSKEIRMFAASGDASVNYNLFQGMTQIMTDIHNAAARVARRKGISVVINSAVTQIESTDDMLTKPNVVYAAPGTDISAEVLNELNAAFKASQP